MQTNKQVYLKALKALFPKGWNDVVDIANKNNNTVSTVILCYLCYNKNIADIMFLNCLDYSKLISHINVKDIPNKQITDDIDITEECCYFIDKLSTVPKMKGYAKAGSVLKKSYLNSYVTYLFLTDENLEVFKVLKECFSRETRDIIINNVKTILANASDLPNHEVFTKYGRFLTDPLNINLSPCYNREKEIDEIIDVLCRKNKNNPILVGQPGVGKTAVVQGLANILMSNKCPKQLQNYHVFELNVTSIVSGSIYRGQLEEKLKTIIDTIITECPNVIVFIDEIHTIMNGKKNDEGDTSGVPMSDILKPYMTANKLKIIGATTESEYRAIEKDGALMRRFNKINIKEPSTQTVLQLMNRLCGEYETYFDLKCSEAVLNTVVNYANLYMPNKYMPDKVIDLLDLSFVTCKNHSNRTELTDLDVIQSVETLTSIKVPVANNEVVDKVNKVLQILKTNIIGQDEALNITEKLLKRYFMGLCNKNKPIGSFLFVGPTGVGKTELCKQLATELFNKEAFVKLDMSEYMEKYSVSKLIGAPPGYIGHSKGGKLTEIVKNNPYSLILFDEIEKAHPDIYNILLQILDEGTLTDSDGVKTNFKNCIIVLTSNVGATNVRDKAKNSVGFTNTELTAKDINKIYETAVKKYFSPEFINRLDNVVYFNSLSKQNIADIVDIELDKLISNFKLKLNCDICIDDSVKTCLYDKCFTTEYGARFVQREIAKLVEDKIIDYIMNNKLLDNTINITINMNNTEIIVNHKILEVVT